MADEERTIRALRAQNNRAIAARDVDGTIALAADDYVLVAGNGTIHRSRDTMRQRWAKTFRNPGQQGCVRQPQMIAMGRHAAMLRAAETRRWRCPGTGPAGRRESYGTYFAHWSKQTGAWRVVSDTYVTLGCTGDGC